MPARGRVLGLIELAEQDAIFEILLRYALRGVRLQLLLRFVLAGFALVVIFGVPPAHYRLACDLVAVGYGVFALVVAALCRNGGVVAARFSWLALFGDVAFLAALALLASASDEQSWTSDILLNGFFIIPMLAATQLRPWVCAAVNIPTVLVYFACSAAARSSNTEPWSSVLLRTAVLAGLGVGGVLFSRVARSRVAAIGSLAVERSQLVDEMVGVEQREQRALAENLHDGALQYVLAARQDLDDARELGEPAAFDRIEQALRVTSELLRSTVSELHPAVLDQAGLLAALQEQARGLSQRGLAVTVTDEGWGRERRTPVDALLFATARELLNNVLKHSGATTARVVLGLADGTARLTVADDGRGVDADQVRQRLTEGHIGLASRRIHLEAAGGRLDVGPGPAGGTVAVAAVPVR